jgi:hypothetical protein
MFAPHKISKKRIRIISHKKILSKRLSRLKLKHKRIAEQIEHIEAQIGSDSQ